MRLFVAWTRRAWVSVSLCAAALLLAGGTAAAVQRPVLLVLGDSMSSEYGLPRDTGWVKLLADRLAEMGHSSRAEYSVVNASISGETTSGGRSRLPALLKQHAPALVVLQLGGNDGLRGLPIAAMRENLRAMIAASRAAGARVLVIGMRLPPNYGRDYEQAFAASFVELARAEKTALVPFLLAGFAEQLDYFQADRIHPNAEAQPRMLDTVWPQLQPLLAPAR